jgi:signal transduction histidine kinase
MLFKDIFQEIVVPDSVRIDMTGIEGLPQLFADSVQIKLVFSNIILNAVQAMTEGGALSITGKKKMHTVEISFQDTGSGIKKADIEKIFEPLYSTKVKGTGLGLAVCKSIVEGHKGSIDVKSTTGKGTTFIVTLPIK